MRDYNKEAQDHPEHKYAYDFDYRMHRFMMRTFLKFKPGKKALELGCYHGRHVSGGKKYLRGLIQCALSSLTHLITSSSLLRRMGK